MNHGGAIPATVSLAGAAARRWDAVVIGAGPAGALAALSLARAGRAVLLVDKASFPRFKVCGCCIGRAAGAMLESAGLGRLIAELGGVSLRTMDLCCGSARVELPIRARVVSRAALDSALVHEAIAAGAAFLPSAAAEVIDPDPGRIRLRRGGADEKVEISAASILTCDGLAGSAVPQLRARVGRSSKIGVAAVIDAPAESGRLIMICGRGGYVGMVRQEDGRANLAAALDPDIIREAGGVGKAVERLFASADLPMPRAALDARWHGTPLLTRRRPPVAGHRTLILGDSASYVEPFTGEGIGWAMACGVAAADVVVQGRMSDWGREHARLVAGRQRVCRVLAWVLRRPVMARAAISLLSKAPQVAALPLWAVHRPLAGSAA